MMQFYIKEISQLMIDVYYLIKYLFIVFEFTIYKNLSL